MKRLISIFCVLLLSSPVMAEKEVVDSAFGFVFGKVYDIAELEKVAESVFGEGKSAAARIVGLWSCDPKLFVPGDYNRGEGVCPYALNAAPKPHPAFKRYLLTLNPKQRLIEVHVSSDKYRTLDDCLQGIDKMNLLQSIEVNRNIRMERERIGRRWFWESGDDSEDPSYQRIEVQCSSTYKSDGYNLRLTYTNLGAYLITDNDL